MHHMGETSSEEDQPVEIEFSEPEQLEPDDHIPLGLLKETQNARDMEGPPSPLGPRH